MQRISSTMAFGTLVAAAMILASPVRAGITVSMDNGKQIFENGKGDVPACTTCHGATGMGNDAMGTPRLAGQVYQFLVKQLEDFATDKRQDTTMFVMNANAKGLSEQDKRDVAAYLSQLQSEPEPSNLEELAKGGTKVGTTYLGKAIVNFGDVDRHIGGCLSCHGHNGRGAEPVYPQLTGQKYVYLVNQLRQWRDGTRTNDPLAQMRKVAQNLTDDDIYNVAAFLATAPVTTPGNPRIPSRHVPFGDH